MRLSDTTIVVTGARSGLGRAMASAFVEEGAAVACSSRSEDRLGDAVEAMNDGQPAGEAVAIPADVRSWPSVRELMETTRERLGPIDVLVNNAGVMQYHVNDDREELRAAELPVGEWDAVLETNLRGPFLCSKAALPPMLERGAGRLIHVSSGHGSSGRANRTAYVASKFGLEGFHESLALEVEGSGVDSVAIRPPDGGIFTERRGELGHTPEGYTHEPSVIAESAVRLAAGAGENGGRYMVSADGTDFAPYERA